MVLSIGHYERVIREEIALDAWGDLLASLGRYHHDYPKDPLHLAGALVHHLNTHYQETP